MVFVWFSVWFPSLLLAVSPPSLPEPTTPDAAIEAPKEAASSAHAVPPPPSRPQPVERPEQGARPEATAGPAGTVGPPGTSGTAGSVGPSGTSGMVGTEGTAQIESTVARPQPSGPGPSPIETAPRFDREYTTVRAPTWRGTGMLVAAGITYAVALTFQGLDSLLCGNCATGGLERAMMATTLGLAVGGAAVRARADAYDDTALRRGRPNTRRVLVTGATVAGVGAIIGLVNEGLWWRCVYAGDGAYRTDGAEFASTFDCRYGISRGLLDLSTGAASAGLALVTWALVYQRHAKAYSGARVIGIRPTFGRQRWGLSLQGRF